MPQLTRLVVTALKDNVTVITAVKKLRYRQIEGLPNGGVPEGQDMVYENTHGITLTIDQTVELDVRENQLPYFQKAIDAGDIEILGMPASAAPAATPSKDKGK